MTRQQRTGSTRGFFKINFLLREAFQKYTFSLIAVAVFLTLPGTSKAGNSIQANQFTEFFSGLFATDQWPARWFCGNWTDFHGWVYIISSFAIWAAYFTIPVVLAYFVSKKKNIPFKSIFLLFISFILFCGFGHLVDGLIFWFPVYRLSALVLALTALVSWGTVFALIKLMPEVLRYKTPKDFQEEIDRIQKELEISNTTFQKMADRMPHFVWTATPEGDINFFNKKFYDYTGKQTFEELAKGKWLNHVHPDDRELQVKLWLESISTGKDCDIEKRFSDSEGNYRWVHTKATPERNSIGEIVIWTGICYDIHETKIQIQLKEDFISIASHELKTPLTAINAYAEILENDLKSINETSNEVLFIKKIRQSLKKLEVLINDLLDISKINNGKLDYNFEHIPFNELVNEVIEFSLKMTKTHSIIINKNFNVMVYADKNRLEQVLVNYINNAIKYSPTSDKVIVEVDQKENEVIVSVEDFGEGFPDGENQKLFERFYRAKSTSKAGGMGIGLFICKEIISGHKGRVWAERKETKGSKFYFSFPSEML
jgi:PAS domain S-box-containing protein